MGGGQSVRGTEKLSPDDARAQRSGHPWQRDVGSPRASPPRHESGRRSRGRRRREQRWRDEKSGGGTTDSARVAAADVSRASLRRRRCPLSRARSCRVHRRRRRLPLFPFDDAAAAAATNTTGSRDRRTRKNPAPPGCALEVVRTTQRSRSAAISSTSGVANSTPFFSADVQQSDRKASGGTPKSRGAPSFSVSRRDGVVNFKSPSCVHLLPPTKPRDGFFVYSIPHQKKITYSRATVFFGGFIPSLVLNHRARESVTNLFLKTKITSHVIRTVQLRRRQSCGRRPSDASAKRVPVATAPPVVRVSVPRDAPTTTTVPETRAAVRCP